MNIFPEGGTSNGKSLLQFKKGAFLGEKRVTPIFLKYHHGHFSPSFEVIDFFPLAWMQMSSPWMKVDVNLMPDFEPNEYLFRTHADKGKERWEIFAWAVRDIMAKEGDFELSDMVIKDRNPYFHYMMGRGTEDPSIALVESKSLLTGKKKDNYNHVGDELKKDSNSKKSGKRTKDYKNEM